MRFLSRRRVTATFSRDSKGRDLSGLHPEPGGLTGEETGRLLCLLPCPRPCAVPVVSLSVLIQSRRLRPDFSTPSSQPARGLSPCAAILARTGANPCRAVSTPFSARVVELIVR